MNGWCPRLESKLEQRELGMRREQGKILKVLIGHGEECRYLKSNEKVGVLDTIPVAAVGRM